MTPLRSSAFFALCSLAVRVSAQLQPKKFVPLPLGQVKPSGWLADQLNLQVNGLAGHEDEFYNYVYQGTWTGGSAAYSNLEEAGSYWFNGLVPTGILSGSATVQSQTKAFLEYVIAHQQSDGWLGPEDGSTDHPKYLWGRYPFLLGVAQMVEADPSLADAVIAPVYKFVQLANNMLNANPVQGVEEWGAARWFDFAIFLQWLYENHPNGNEDLLINTMQRLKATGTDWKSIFSEQYFPKTAVENLGDPPFSQVAWHGVNVAEGLKDGPTSFRFTKDQSDLDGVTSGWDRLFQYHGRPSGIFGADEYLAGLDAVRGTELCTVVEAMYSGSVLYQQIGDRKFADRVERIAYNALPAALTGDMWSHQYLQQQNQIAAQNMNPNPFPRDGPYSNVFGLEPNYPCCTVNHPQGWPKFISNSFLKTADNSGLVQLYHGPMNVQTTLANGNSINVVVDTAYPFGDISTMTIQAGSAFTYLVRIPNGVTGGTVTVNGGDAIPVKSDSTTGLHAVSVGQGETIIVLNLPSNVTTESRPQGSVAVQRGPLHYAFDINRSQKVLNTNPNQNKAVDLQFNMNGPWQYAIDTDTLKFNSKQVNGLPSPIFDANQPPLTITVTACPISWDIAGDAFAAFPPTNPTCTGNQTEITLWPYGATKLRIGELPIFESQ